MLLEVTSGELAGTQWRLPEGESVIGRTHGNVVLPDGSVSSEHAAIEVRGASATVRDLGSRNGTYLDERRVLGTQPVHSGATLRFGRVTLRLSAEQPTAALPALAPASHRRTVAVAAVAVLAVGGMLAVLLSQRDDEPVRAPDTVASAAPAPTATPTPTRTPPPDPFELAEQATLEVTSAGVGSGTGWLVRRSGAGGYVVTNEHVVAGAASFTVNLEGEEAREAELVGASACDDIAVLRVADAAGIEQLTLATEIERGDEVVVSGFPATDADESGLVTRRATVSDDRTTISSAERPFTARYDDLVRIDGEVIPGDSGGPLIGEADGRVVGVNSITAGGSTGYAISARRVREILDYLIDGSSVPGFSLEYTDDGSNPTVTRVDLESLERAGVVADAGHELASIDRMALSGLADISPRAICDILPKFGDGRSEPVRLGFRKPDNNYLAAIVNY